MKVYPERHLKGNLVCRTTIGVISMATTAYQDDQLYNRLLDGNNCWFLCKALTKNTLYKAKFKSQ